MNDDERAWKRIDEDESAFRRQLRERLKPEPVEFDKFKGYRERETERRWEPEVL